MTCRDLRAMRWGRRLLPVDWRAPGAGGRDFFFWAVGFLGVVPLLIAALPDSALQLRAFAMFFALVWAVLMRRFVLGDQTAVPGLLFGVFGFTALIALAVLQLLYRFPLSVPALSLYRSPVGVLSLFGFIFQVGLFEELCKLLPLLIFLRREGRLRRASVRRLDPPGLVMVAVVSGLGFASMENLDYGQQAVRRSVEVGYFWGPEFSSEAVQGAVSLTMLRSLSLVFCHATWSGLAASIVAQGVVRGAHLGAPLVLGLGFAAVLHGLYDWLGVRSALLAAAVAGFSFLVFHAQVQLLRRDLEATGRSGSGEGR